MDAGLVVKTVLTLPYEQQQQPVHLYPLLRAINDRPPVLTDALHPPLHSPQIPPRPTTSFFKILVSGNNWAN